MYLTLYTMQNIMKFFDPTINDGQEGYQMIGKVSSCDHGNAEKSQAKKRARQTLQTLLGSHEKEIQNDIELHS